MLSPGLVSYHVSNFVALCHPASERSPSTTIAPPARLMSMGGSESSAPNAGIEAHSRAMSSRARQFTVDYLRHHQYECFRIGRPKVAEVSFGMVNNSAGSGLGAAR